MTSSTFTTDKISTWCSWNRPAPVSLTGIGDRVKTKKPQGSLSDLAVQIVFYLFAHYAGTMPYAHPIVKVYYLLFHALGHELNVFLLPDVVKTSTVTLGLFLQ